MHRLKGTALGVFILTTLPGLALSQAKSRHCTQLPPTTATRWGGNQRVVIDLRNKPVRTVEGIVTGPGEGTFKTLIQVFPRVPSSTRKQTSGQEDGPPIATCETAEDGAFAFSLPPGEYELLMSQDKGVDATSVLVTVKHGSHVSKTILVRMINGT
jgi:hypothetical protein